MTKLQKVIFDIWIDIDKVFKKNNIPLIPWFGTLLGSVRHDGFIPWDDDMDFAILEPDIEKVADMLRKFLPKKYLVLTLKTNRFASSILQIYDTSHKTSVGKKTSVDEIEHPFVDIITLVNTNEENGNTFRNRFWQEVNWAKNSLIRNTKWLLFIRPFTLLMPQKLLSHLIRKRAKKTHESGKKYVYEYTSAYYKTFDSNIIKEFIPAKFEGHKIMIPKKFDEILTTHYGDWRLVPKKEDRQTHDIELID